MAAAVVQSGGGGGGDKELFYDSLRQHGKEDKTSEKIKKTKEELMAELFVPLFVGKFFFPYINDST